MKDWIIYRVWEKIEWIDYQKLEILNKKNKNVYLLVMESRVIFSEKSL